MTEIANRPLPISIQSAPTGVGNGQCSVRPDFGNGTKNLTCADCTTGGTVK